MELESIMLSNGAAEGDGSMVGEVQTVSSSTLAIHADSEEARVPDGLVDAAAPPISVSTTFEAGGKYSYSRCGNPTLERAEKVLGTLHSAPPALLYSSGMAATFALLYHLCPEYVAIEDGYHGTHHAIDLLAKKHNAGKTRKGEERFKKLTLDIHDIAKLKRGDVIWLEVPKNPTCEVADIHSFAQMASTMGVILAVDQTFAPPPLLDAFHFGADVVMHSTTKFLSGHSDCLGGALVVRDSDLRSALAGERALVEVSQAR